MRQHELYIRAQQHLLLNTSKTIFWEEERLLIVSDLHIGKTNHFRKFGFNIPLTVHKNDLMRLFDDIQYFKPKAVICVGDLTHSTHNQNFQLFSKWLADITSLTKFILVTGNHDVHAKQWLLQQPIEKHAEELEINNFTFIHDVTDAIPQNQSEEVRNKQAYYISGHIHPAFVIRGKANQTLKFPCFYFGENHALLPAFSDFTGGYSIKPKSVNDQIFVVTTNKIIPV